MKLAVICCFAYFLATSVAIQTNNEALGCYESLKSPQQIHLAINESSLCQQFLAPFYNSEVYYNVVNTSLWYQCQNELQQRFSNDESKQFYADVYGCLTTGRGPFIILNSFVRSCINSVYQPDPIPQSFYFATKECASFKNLVFNKEFQYYSVDTEVWETCKESLFSSNLHSEALLFYKSVDNCVATATASPVLYSEASTCIKSLPNPSNTDNIFNDSCDQFLVQGVNNRFVGNYPVDVNAWTKCYQETENNAERTSVQFYLAQINSCVITGSPNFPTAQQFKVYTVESLLKQVHRT